MRVTMLETRRGASNGFTVKRYDQGEEYELSDRLALNFISQGAANLPARSRSNASEKAGAVAVGGADAPAKKTPAKKTQAKRKAIACAPENKGAASRA